MEHFAMKVRDKLPMLLRDIVDKSVSAEDADMLLIGSIATISACLPNIYGVYDRRRVAPNLYLFVSAPASAGKGRLSLCKELARPIHAELRRQYLLEIEMVRKTIEESGKKCHLSDINVPQRTLFLPANSSATAVYQTLNDNGGRGLIFETEGDTLANVLKQDYGNFSDGLRKAFHHESVSYMRRKEREWVEIDNPQLSVVLAGTPRQIYSLIPDAENGLFSRFVMLKIEMQEVWKDVFSFDVGSQSDDELFAQFGERFYRFYNRLCDIDDELRFTFTRHQERQFNERFAEIQRNVLTNESDELVASVRRFGLIAFRLAMILTALRYEDGMFPTCQLLCTNDDFDIAMTMTETLLTHTFEVYREMNEFSSSASISASANAQTGMKIAQIEMLLSQLPTEFTTADAMQVGETLKLSRRCTTYYIRQMLDSAVIQRLSHGQYAKAS